MTKTIQLKTPIQTHEGPKNHHIIREPPAQDFIEMNVLPYETRGLGSDMSLKIDFRLAAGWASRLSGLDEILIGKMGRSDFLNLVAAVNDVLADDGDAVGN